MKEKIMNIKNILKIIISIFIIFSMIKSCSQATMSNATIGELRDNLTILQNKGLLSPNFMNNFQPSSEYWGTYYIILITNQATDNVYIGQAYNGDTITDNGNLWTTNGSSVKNILCTRYKNGHNDNTDGTKSTTWGAFPGNDYTYTYAYSPHYDINTTKLVVAAGEEYGGKYISSGLDFTTSTDYITVNIGNETRTDVIRTHKKSTIENPIWRNNRKL